MEPIEPMDSIIPMKLKFIIDQKLNPENNFKKLIKVCSIVHLEFFTTESLKHNLNHIFSIDRISVYGDVNTADKSISELCKTFKDYLKNYINSEENFETKNISLLYIKYYLNEFLLHNHTFTNYLFQLPDTFVLNNLNEKETIDVALHQLNLNKDILFEIQQHLNIRSTHFTLFIEYVELLIAELAINNSIKNIPKISPNEMKEDQLLQVWLGLKQMGFVDFGDQSNFKLLESKMRKEFFELFNLEDKQYNRKHQNIITRKTYEPEFLIEMVKSLSKK